MSIERLVEPGDSELMLRVKSLLRLTPDYGRDERLATFQVITPIKGTTEPDLIVRTDWEEAMCGYPFEVARSYLVYAATRDGALRASLCSRCAPAENTAEEVAELMRAQL